jgi:hypothetical protein
VAQRIVDQLSQSSLIVVPPRFAPFFRLPVIAVANRELWLWFPSCFFFTRELSGQVAILARPKAHLWEPANSATRSTAKRAGSLTGNQWAGGPFPAHITNHFNELATSELATAEECA